MPAVISKNELQGDCELSPEQERAQALASLENE